MYAIIIISCTFYLMYIKEIFLYTMEPPNSRSVGNFDDVPYSVNGGYT